MTEAARLSVPLLNAHRAPVGRTMMATEGHVDGRAFDVIITETQIHIGFAESNGPAFAINLNALVKEAVNAIEETVFGKRSGIR
jgi:hypothetical protein